MKTSKKLSFSEKIIRRNWILRFVLILMFVYMVVVGELGLGDSRYMSRMAADVSRLIFFGGMIWVIRKIILLCFLHFKTVQDSMNGTIQIWLIGTYRGRLFV